MECRGEPWVSECVCFCKEFGDKLYDALSFIKMPILNGILKNSINTEFYVIYDKVIDFTFVLL